MSSVRRSPGGPRDPENTCAGARPGSRTIRGAVLVLVAALSCGRQSAPPEPLPARPPAPAREAVSPLRQRWVTVYDPRRAWNGYTLTIHDRRIPVLLDMNGRVAHTWPEARVKSRVRLLPDGSILGLGLGRSVVEYDWQGRKTWEFRTEDAIPHHDVVRLRNGDTLVLVLRNGEGADTLLEVNRAGRVVWTWRAAERLGALLPAHPPHKNDVTHINSVQELPENPWFAAGDARFRPGNLLLSARNLDTVFVVERASGKVVWSYGGDLDRQHEALMLGPELPGAGRIQVFDNRPASYFGDHQSEILELDPRHPEPVWRYRAPGFFSPTGGSQQRLPNGNLLVTSTRGGRVFEVTADGTVVWEWTPPYEPVRALRVARGYCPQLAALANDLARPVLPARGYRYVDSDAYRFARRGSRKTIAIDGATHVVLTESQDCRDLLLPLGAAVDVGYGVDRARAAVAHAGEPVDPVFLLTLRRAGASEDVVLLRDTIGASGPAWRAKSLPLDAFALQSVRLCVAIEGLAPGHGERPLRERYAFWEQPDIRTALDRARQEDEAHALDGLTPEERAVQLQHLRALGYIN